MTSPRKDDTRQAWTCTIGTLAGVQVPDGADPADARRRSRPMECRGWSRENRCARAQRPRCDPARHSGIGMSRQVCPTSGGCPSCPYGFSDAAENAINLGCVPSVYEINEMARRTGHPWGCHGHEGRVCAGYIAYATEKGGLPVVGSPISYARWYNDGEAYIASLGETPSNATEVSG